MAMGSSSIWCSIVFGCLAIFIQTVACHDTATGDERKSHDHGQRIHECSDDHAQRIQKGVNLHRVYMPYKNHPYERSNSFDGLSENEQHIPLASGPRRRSMLTQSETAPIRISAHYDALTITDVHTSNQIEQLKSVIGAIVNYYEKAVRVVPVDGPFFMQRPCRLSGTAFSPPVSCLEYFVARGGQISCQDAPIPVGHFGTEYFFDQASGTATEMPGGTGIADTDLMLYVTADFTSDSCGGSTLAHAGPCAYDQYGRPVAGNINICELFWTGDLEWKKDVQTMLHEMTHITIFLSDLWDEFKDASGNTLPLSEVYDTSVSPPVLKSPALLQMVREHYGCATAAGLPVQSLSSSHVHSRYAFADTMNPSITSSMMYYTKFLLALMEDSGWYLPNYELAEPYFFGLNAGCTFLSSDSGSCSNFYEQHFCSSNAADGCSADYSAPASCSSSSLSMGCLYRTPTGGPDYQSICYDERGTSIDSPARINFVNSAETWGVTSRCAVLQTTGSTSATGYCFEHVCFGWDGVRWGGVRITVTASEDIVCSRTDAWNTTALSSISTREIVCPDIDILCGTDGPSYGTCYWGHFSTAEGGCVCTAGYTGSDCNTRDNTTDVEWSTPNPVVPAPTFWKPTLPTYNTVCMSGFPSASYNGEWTYVADSEATYTLPVYYKESSGRYLYWRFYSHAWFIGSTPGANSYFCLCQISWLTANIADCDGHWSCGSGARASYVVCPGDPTEAPSQAPTNRVVVPTQSPTKLPTKMPTALPTKNPTRVPTGSPTERPTTRMPTRIPTDSPTKSPTNPPTTAMPSQLPTKTPTSSPTTANPTVRGQTPSPTKLPSLNPTNFPTNSPSFLPTATPTSTPSRPPTMTPTTRNPTMVGETFSPSKNPTLRPSASPTAAPSTASPTNPSAAPTHSPVFPHSLVATITLRLESMDDSSGDFNCDVTQTNLVSLTETFTRAYIRQELEDSGEFVNVEYSMDVSLTLESDGIAVSFALSASSGTELTAMDALITSGDFQQDLIDFLAHEHESADAGDDVDVDADCFDFAVVIDNNNAPGNSGSGGILSDNSVDMFNFAEYGTTEYLVVTLALLLLFVAIGWVIYYRCVIRNTEAETKGEFQRVQTRASNVTQDPVAINEAIAGALFSTSNTPPRSSHLALPANSVQTDQAFVPRPDASDNEDRRKSVFDIDL